MAQIDTTAVINSVRFAQQGSNPSSPAATYWLAFIKSDGLYLKDSAGNVLGPIRGMANDTLWDAAGDLAIGTGANTGAKLAIGTAGQGLRVNAGATSLEYVTGGRVLISEQTPTGTGTVTFSSGLTGYKDLRFEWVGRSTQVATSTLVNIRINNDTTDANYRQQKVYGYASTVASDGSADAKAFRVAGASSPAGSCGSGIFDIIQSSGTTFFKQIFGRYALRYDDTTIYELSGSFAAEYESALAVSRVDLVLDSGNWDTGSTIRAYGMY